MELLLILTALLANLTGLGAGERSAAPVGSVAAVRMAQAERAATVVATVLAPRRPVAARPERQADPVRALDLPQAAPLYADRLRE